MKMIKLEEEESDGWLASYSDLITDLLAVFVLLFSFALLMKGISKTTASADIEVLEGGSGVAAEDASVAIIITIIMIRNR